MNIANVGLVSSKLLIDIGNTNLKWCRLEGGKLSDIRFVPHQKGLLPDLPMRCWADEKHPDSVFIANVAAPSLNQIIDHWMRSHWSLAPVFLLSETQAFGVTNGYTKPEQLGVDRWLTLIAVHNRYHVSACIVDCGTAITIDVITQQGEHLGGVILPGFQLMREALLEKTHIPRVQEISNRVEILGKDTESAVASACLNAGSALVERVAHRVMEILPRNPDLILTGTDATLLQSVLTLPSKIRPNLIMQGLSVVAEGPVS